MFKPDFLIVSSTGHTVLVEQFDNALYTVDEVEGEPPLLPTLYEVVNGVLYYMGHPATCEFVVQVE